MEDFHGKNMRNMWIISMENDENMEDVDVMIDTWMENIWIVIIVIVIDMVDGCEWIYSEWMLKTYENLWIVIFEKNDHQISEEWIWKTDIVDGPAKSCRLRPETPMNVD